jgi:S1-C subfamily serine protease
MAAARRLLYFSAPLILHTGKPGKGQGRRWRTTMSGRFFRFALIIVLVLLAAQVMQPYVFRLMFAATTSRPFTPRGELSEIERSTIAVFEKVSPSVVQVVGRQTGSALSSEDAEGGVQSGTGFVWDQAGNIVTNNHVVAGTSEVAVRLSSGEVIGADIVGTAPNYDLGVIRLRDLARLPPPVDIGSSADLKVGQFAYAIGNPFGLDQSLTTGVISALSRRLPTSSGREIPNAIQTDAAVNPGNSGGPLLDSSGRVIGVTTAIISPSGSNAGIGFAIPVDVVNRVVPQVIASGHVPTPGIGIVTANEAAATRLGVEGLVILRTIAGSPAARAGLRGVDLNSGTLGDVIVGANGKPVRRMTDLTDQLETVGVDRTISLSVQRGGRTTAIDVPIIDIGQAQ